MTRNTQDLEVRPFKKQGVVSWQTHQTQAKT
jgi:hypothetical protein